MSDDALRQFGAAARYMCSPRANAGKPTREVFVVQLEKAIAEWHGGALIAADACSNIPGLGLSLGYEDLEEGRRSLRKLSALDFQVACFGHGKLILKDAALKFRRLWN